ncbi:MAG: 3-isopropylmalate dehydratase [Desulfitibacter sp. BRH_c19]|nr:MAG: 3-isopropylmalate dehydratase [Desulfitibacter sp. BRH_c19]
MNEIEKYLAKAAGKDQVAVGEDITVNVNLVITHDVTGPMAVEQFREIGIKNVFDPGKVVFVLDHIMPAASPEARAFHNILKKFQKEFGVVLYDKSEGVIHQVVAEKHRLDRGSIIVGADSHTCTAGAYGVLAFGVGATELAASMATGTIDIEVPETYELRLDGEMKPGVYAKDIILHLIGKFGTAGFTDKAVIYTGSAVEKMSLEDKMTISNMGIEMGTMISYFSEEKGAEEVNETFVFNIEEISPSISCPHSPGNVKRVEETLGVEINQVVIGSCTNGRLVDMRIAAGILEGNKVHENVTLIVVPASNTIASAMNEEGITKIMMDAGAIITNPGCGPCFGAHMGLAAKEDVVVSTTNRNFPGRMGHKEANIYLASPRTAAESAVAGKIVLPGTVKALGGIA